MCGGVDSEYSAVRVGHFQKSADTVQLGIEQIVTMQWNGWAFSEKLMFVCKGEVGWVGGCVGTVEGSVLLKAALRCWERLVGFRGKKYEEIVAILCQNSKGGMYHSLRIIGENNMVFRGRLIRFLVEIYNRILSLLNLLNLLLN